MKKEIVIYHEYLPKVGGTGTMQEAIVQGSPKAGYFGINPCGRGKDKISV